MPFSEIMITTGIGKVPTGSKHFLHSCTNNTFMARALDIILPAMELLGHAAKRQTLCQSLIKLKSSARNFLDRNLVSHVV